MIEKMLAIVVTTALIVMMGTILIIELSKNYMMYQCYETYSKTNRPTEEIRAICNK